jgi:hypothetical protein
MAHFIQGIPQQWGTSQIAFFPCYFIFKNENVKVKVKYMAYLLHSKLLKLGIKIRG